MIYACLRAWRECPNLLLWNVGAWAILAVLIGDATAFRAIYRPAQWHDDYDIAFGRQLPPAPPPTAMQQLHDAARSPPAVALRGAVVVCGFCLMIFAAWRGILRRRL